MTQLRIVEGLPTSHYPIRNGSLFLVEAIESEVFSPLLRKIEEEDESDVTSFMTNKTDTLTNQSEQDSEFTVYFEGCLQRMLDAVR